MARGLLFLAIFLGICTGRVFLDGSRHLNKGEKLRRTLNLTGAFAEFEDAARAYFPGSPFPRQALLRMERMAKSMQMRGATDEAIESFQKIRRAILSTRHIAQPNRDILTRVETVLERSRNDKDKKLSNTMIVRFEDPSPVASLLLTLGLLAWIAGAAGLCLILPGALKGSKGRNTLWIITIGGLTLWISMAWII